MKKKILGLAAIAMSLVAFSGKAQTSATATATNQETVQCVKGDKKCDKTTDCKKDFNRFGKNGKARKSQVNPYDGLNLTEAQQAQLQQLDAKRKGAREQQTQARKDNRQANDSARIADRRNARKNYLEEVKAIIGPDQYVIFLENSYVNAAPRRDGNKAAFSQGKRDKAQAGNRRNGDRKGNRDARHAFNKAVKAEKANS